MYKIMSHTNDMSFIPNPYAFSSSCFTETVGTFKIMLDRRGESNIIVSFPISGRKLSIIDHYR